MKPVPFTALANTFEFEQAAHEKIPLELFDAIQGSDRRPFDHITLRPRMMVDTRQLDLSRDLLGMKLFAPIVANASVHVSARPERFHPAGDKAVADAAAEARAVTIVNGMGGNLDTTWFRVASAVQAKRAADAGAKVLVTAAPAIVKAAKIPVMVEDVMTAAEAARSLDQGAAGLIVSRRRPVGPHPMAALASVVDRAGKAPVLIGGDFRRGTDILQALALGAAAVRVTRPIVWALAAYGPRGVTAIVEMLQNELARNMAMMVKVNLAALSRADATIHRRAHA